MSMIAIILVCLAAYWLLKSRAQTKRKPKNIQCARSPQRKYMAASICYFDIDRPCSAVKAVGTKRFLVKEVLKLPLTDCDVSKCNCTYVRHEDRRSRDDRRAPYLLQFDLYAVAGQAEQRTLIGRRKTDLGADEPSDFGLNDIEWTT